MADTAAAMEQLQAAIGQRQGPGAWITVDQERINRFADATEDHQWIHVDVERAKETPFGGTIAHGFYTQSLGPGMSYKMFTLEGFAFGVNYGANRIRFPAPMPVGGKVRMRAQLTSVEDVPGGAQITVTQTFEREGGEKPVCVAETLSRVYTG